MLQKVLSASPCCNRGSLLLIPETRGTDRYIDWGVVYHIQIIAIIIILCSSALSASAYLPACTCIPSKFSSQLELGYDKEQFRDQRPVLRIRIRIRIRIHVFLGLQDPDPDPLVRGMDSDPDPALDPDPDPSIIMQK